MKNCIINKDFFNNQKCSPFTLIKDKNELFDNIKKFKLPFQAQINTDIKKIGIEIEFANANLIDVNEDIKNMYEGKFLVYGQDWITKPDESITNSDTLNKGGEVVSPILFNTNKEWEQLDEVCLILKDNKAFINDECSIHMHFDIDELELTLNNTEKLLKLWAIYEPIIYKFCLGEESFLREHIFEYASPMRDEIISSYTTSSIENYITEPFDLGNKRRKGINLVNVSNKFNEMKCNIPTIEFRCASGSLNPRIIQNITRFYTGLLNSIKNEDKLVNYYIEKHIDCLECDNDIDDELIRGEYETVDLEKSLELIDIVFNNNHDKMCFLKQYIKDEEIETEKKYIK